MRYDVVADTSKFDRPMQATRGELNQARRAFEQTRTPAEKYGQEITKIGNLYRKNLIDAATYRRSLDEAKNKYREATKEATRYQKAVGAINTRISGMAGAFAGMAVVSMASSHIKQAFTDIDELAKTSRKLGLASEDLAMFQLAAGEIAGMETSGVNMALQRFGRRMAQAAQGTGEALPVFEELGLSAQKLTDSGITVAFQEVADAIQAVENPLDRLRMAQKLFDSEGAAMVAVLNQGGQALDDYRTKIQQLGLVVQDEEQVEAFNDAMGELKLSLTGLSREAAVFAAELTPAIQKMTEYLSTARDVKRIAQEAGAGKYGGMLAEGAAQNPYIGIPAAVVRNIGTRAAGAIRDTAPRQQLQNAFEAVAGKILGVIIEQSETLKSIEQKTQPTEAL